MDCCGLLHHVKNCRYRQSSSTLTSASSKGNRLSRIADCRSCRLCFWHAR
jgi:hypothetical protein